MIGATAVPHRWPYPWPQLWRLFANRHANPLLAGSSGGWRRPRGTTILWIAAAVLAAGVLHFVSFPLSQIIVLVALMSGYVGQHLGRVASRRRIEEYYQSRLTRGEVLFGIFYPTLPVCAWLLFPFVLLEGFKHVGSKFQGLDILYAGASGAWAYLLIVRYSLLFGEAPIKVPVATLATLILLVHSGIWSALFILPAVLVITHLLVRLAVACAGARLYREIDPGSLARESWWESVRSCEFRPGRLLDSWRESLGPVGGSLGLLLLGWVIGAGVACALPAWESGNSPGMRQYAQVSYWVLGGVLSFGTFAMGHRLLRVGHRLGQATPMPVLVVVAVASTVPFVVASGGFAAAWIWDATKRVSALTPSTGGTRGLALGLNSLLAVLPYPFLPMVLAFIALARLAEGRRWYGVKSAIPLGLCVLKVACYALFFSLFLPGEAGRGQTSPFWTQVRSVSPVFILTSGRELTTLLAWGTLLLLVPFSLQSAFLHDDRQLPAAQDRPAFRVILGSLAVLAVLVWVPVAIEPDLGYVLRHLLELPWVFDDFPPHTEWIILAPWIAGYVLMAMVALIAGWKLLAAAVQDIAPIDPLPTPGSGSDRNDRNDGNDGGTRAPDSWGPRA